MRHQIIKCIIKNALAIHIIKSCASAIFSLPVPGSGFKSLILGLIQRLLPLCYLANLSSFLVQNYGSQFKYWILFTIHSSMIPNTVDTELNLHNPPKLSGEIRSLSASPSIHWRYLSSSLAHLPFSLCLCQGQDFKP